MKGCAHRILAGAFLALAWGCNGDPGITPEAQDPVISSFEGVTLVEQDADGTQWHLSAREGGGREREGTGDLRGVAVWFERSDRRIRLTAGTAAVTRGDRVELGDRVEVRWDEYVARAPSATYLRGQGRIRGDGVVELVGPGMHVRGRGLDVDVEGRRARVGGRVEAVFEGGAR